MQEADLFGARTGRDGIGGAEAVVGDAPAPGGTPRAPGLEAEHPRVRVGVPEAGRVHLHLALGAESVQEAYAAKVYGQLLKGDRQKSARLRVLAARGPELLECGWAKEWGFGFVDVQPMRHGSKGLARYLTKYVCKDGVSGRSELAETVDHPDVPARPIYISRRLTAKTRCTMRNLRLRRYYWSWKD
ncbi:MAG TPA: hypothetical protein VGC05_10350 [Mycobacterium sp.]